MPNTTTTTVATSARSAVCSTVADNPSIEQDAIARKVAAWEIQEQEAATDDNE